MKNQIKKETLLNILETDLAAQYSVENKDFLNMQMVLRAYGYDHSIEDGIAALEMVVGKIDENTYQV